MNKVFNYKTAGNITNLNSLRTVCFWAGGFGLVQSLIWIVLTLIGILSYNCIISVGGTFNYGNLFQVVFLQLYFMGTCNNSIPVYDNSMLRQVNTVLGPEDIIIWNSVYLALAICWLLVSVVIIIYLKRDQPRMLSSHLWAWIFVTFCICGMDLALGTIFGIDFTRFHRKAYSYSLTNIYVGDVNADAAQLLAGMVVSISMMFLSLKGYVLWIINAGFLVYLSIHAKYVNYDYSETTNLFMPRKEIDDILVTRPPIHAYQEELKPSVLSTVSVSGSFKPDNHVKENAAVIKHEIIARAALLSKEVALQERRFRNLNSFQQYPPPSSPESSIGHQPKQQQISPPVVPALPAPDYTPPMQRAAQNHNHNQRLQ